MTYYKVTRDLLVLRNLVFKFHLPLDNLFTEFSSGKGKLLSIANNGFITMDYKDDSTEWNPNKSVLIGSNTLYRAVKAFTEYRDLIYNNDVFFSDSNDKLILYGDTIKEYTRVYKINRTSYIQIKPTIIVDDNSKTYEAIALFINSSSNFVELYLEDFESIGHLLSKVDLFQYSLAVLSTLSNDAVDKPSKSSITVNKFTPKGNNLPKDVFRTAMENKSTLIKEENILD